MTMIETNSPEPATALGAEVSPGAENAIVRLATPAETAEQLVVAEKHGMELTVRVLDLESLLAVKESQLHEARFEQITDGSDPRLERFWEKAGRIADNADFCSEYDRMAEAMNGPRRSRDYEVTAEFNVTVRVTRTVQATDTEDAEEQVDSDSFTTDEIVQQIGYNGIEDWELISTDAEEA